ncbi:uncharacterized protein [Parasteatoda tepidariorum]|uniref:uncharacterized protein isoform X1 n=1 Tax=Parasteatoda tepidariorum TaxID=114398 RepID=UPI0039BD356B
MSTFDQSHILDIDRSNLSNASSQQYLEVGSNTFIGTKDGIKYALLPTADNKLKLCEVIADADTNVSTSFNSWSPSFQSVVDVEDNLTSFINPQKKLITLRKEATPCRGQGDESGNSIISTPDSTSRYKNFGNDILEKSSELLDENQYKLDDTTQLTYTTLLSKQDQKLDTLDSVSYSIPITYFQVPQPVQSPVISKSIRDMKANLKAPQLPINKAIPYPQCSPIPISRGRGHRQRRSRQTLYQYRGPLMHSTPTSTSSSSLNDNSPMSSLDSTSNSSISSCNESQPSLDYPRVPNNTPNSEEIGLDYKKKVFDIQWIPHIQSQIADFEQIDPREMHNEKERKRRLRIKTACHIMKNLLPGVYHKTDNATVFENAVHFISFMRESVMSNTLGGTDYDMEFLHQA